MKLSSMDDFAWKIIRQGFDRGGENGVKKSRRMEALGGVGPGGLMW